MSEYKFPSKILDDEGEVIDPPCPFCEKPLRSVWATHQNHSLYGFSEHRGARVLVNLGKDMPDEDEDLSCAECNESVINYFVEIDREWVWKGDLRRGDI